MVEVQHHQSNPAAACGCLDEGLRGLVVEAEVEVAVDLTMVDVEGLADQVDEGGHLRGEGEATADRGVVERLDTKGIARAGEGALLGVEHREGEHAAEPGQAVPAPVLPRYEQDLGVGLRGEGAADRLELDAQLAVVVDLAVEHQDVAAVG